MMTGSRDCILTITTDTASTLERENLPALLDAHLDGLVNYLARLTADRASAEDLAQESFLRLFRALETRPAGTIAPKPYLYTIAINLARKAERKRKRFALLQPLLGHWFGRQATAPPGERLERDGRQRHLARALAELPLTFRVPLVLHVIECWPYDRIAGLLGVAEGTVKSRINRGKTKLREILADEDPRGAS